MQSAGRACPNPDALKPLGARYRLGGAQRREQRVQMAEIMDFDVEVKGVKAAVAVGQMEVDAPNFVMR